MEGKTALISGATSGIGRATSVRLAAAGCRLILLARRTARLEELAAELDANYGTECHLITADVRDREKLSRKLSALPEDWKKIDLLLNNAGKAKGFDPIHEGDYDHWDEMIDVNLKGLLTLTREVSPLMVSRGAGTIINVCSTAGKEVYPNGNVYCATKHAVDALTYAMRLDLVKYGIRVGQICPAHVEETEFAVVRFDGDRQRAKIYEDFQPLRSRDVADAVYFMFAQPAHVNIMDVVLQGTQQASSTVVDRSGREKFKPA
ncbi:NAD(P)-dependent oxidoreductase [Lewinella sp. 4G2]|nr:NAD(P)-dependent oxidoreductase [Lewinella sp. 4G2]